MLTSFVRGDAQDHAAVVYRSEEHDITVTFTQPPNSEPLVEFALGSQVRTFPLAEFTHFWLTMIEMGRQAVSGSLASSVDLHLPRKKKM